jgi:hypothetical protein
MLGIRELLSEVEHDLDSYIEHDSLRFPIEAHLAVCHARSAKL